MAPFPDAPPGFPSWRAEERVSVWPALDQSWLDPAGSIADTYLCDEPEQAGQVLGHIAEKLPCAPGNPDLQRMLEAQLPRQYPVLVGRFSHQQADQVVCQPVHPHFLRDHGWRLAPETLHAQSALDVAKVKFDIPALPKQLFQFAFRRLAWIQQRRDPEALARTSPALLTNRSPPGAEQA